MRKTDEQIYDEYVGLMELKNVPDFIRLWGIKCIALARQEEPRINAGTHFIDWINICDDDDDFDSFYGKDYFAHEDTGLTEVTPPE